MLEDEDDDEDSSSDWTKLVDRGGLFRVNNLTYSFFEAVENIVRQHLQVKRIKDVSGMKNILFPLVLPLETFLQIVLITRNA